MKKGIVILIPLILTVTATITMVPQVKGECVVDPTSLDFGAFCCDGGYNYVDMTFTITNTGGDTLSGSVTESCEHYSIAHGGGGYSLAPGESLTVTVRFQPEYAGLHECTIETGNDLCSDVLCSGVGDTTCQVSSVLWADFVCVGDYIESTFTITNTGEDPFSGNITLSFGAPYSIVSGGGAYTLPPGESRMVTVRFTPTFPGGMWWDRIETGYDLCCYIYCYCSGGVCCYVAPNSLNFGEVDTGSYLDQTFYIANNGPDTFSVNVTESCQHYTIISGGGAYPLAPDEYLPVVVRFAPTVPGIHTCTIEIDGDAVDCSNVSCTGIGGGIICGDCNQDWMTNIADVVCKLNYLFGGGPLPCPPEAVDHNGDGVVNVADVIAEINYLFFGQSLECPLLD